MLDSFDSSVTPASCEQPTDTRPQALPPDCVLLNDNQLAALLGVCVNTIQTRALAGGGPQCVWVSRRGKRYRLADVRDWLDRLADSGTAIERAQ